MYDVLLGLVNMNESINLQTSMSADVFRVRIEGRVAIRMARTTASAAVITLAQIVKKVCLGYVRLT